MSFLVWDVRGDVAVVPREVVKAVLASVWNVAIVWGVKEIPVVLARAVVIAIV